MIMIQSIYAIYNSIKSSKAEKGHPTYTVYQVPSDFKSIAKYLANYWTVQGTQGIHFIGLIFVEKKYAMKTQKFVYFYMYDTFHIRKAKSHHLKTVTTQQQWQGIITFS